MFRLIDRYLIREILPYVLLALLLLTAIIFAQEASRFSELLVIATRNGLPMQTLARIMSALVPGILVFTLPISLLIGTLVGMGRLSGDSEIIALGASGTSRMRILAPALTLALIVAVAMLYITTTVLPRSVQNLSDLKANQSLIFQGLKTEIKPRVFEESIPQKVLYIEDIDRAQNLWHNIFLVDMGDGDSEMKILTAASGSLSQGEKSNMPELFLHQGTFHVAGGSQSAGEESSQNPSEEVSGNEPSSLDNQTDASANGAMPREKKKDRGQNNYTAQWFENNTVKIEFSDDKREDAAGIDKQPDRVEEMEWADLINYTPSAEEYREWRAEIHKRLALPTACLVFALLGVAFGISNVRTGRSFGLLLGLAITIIYYLIALSGNHYAVSGKLPVWLGIWLANIALGALGIVLLILQRRPGADPLALLSRIRHAWPARKDAATHGNGGAATMTATDAASQLPLRSSFPATPRRVAVPRLMPRLLDRLVLSDLTRFFLFILGGMSALFLIITLFQLLDSITRNRIEWSVVANYLFFLLPMTVNYIAPLAALVAVMVTFGILQKTSQVVALKASGQSIYRMALPAVLAAVMLSGVVFLNQDYVLPFANRRQNKLRYMIRKGQEPPRTFFQTKNQWLFGMDSRIFNYARFDPTNNSFARLTVLDLERNPFTIKRRIYARRARWDDATQQWVLENGWERQFQGEKTVAYHSFKEQRIELTEQPEYFKKDLLGSNSMTYSELQRKIADLQQSGFDVLDMKIALYGKIAFPITCIVMVLVGLPFSFSVGKRGALYGVAIGIAIGLAYWGLLGLFEQMGRYEMLPPLLAAWGPNMLFGAGGVYLFLTSRT